MLQQGDTPQWTKQSDRWHRTARNTNQHIHMCEATSFVAVDETRWHRYTMCTAGAEDAVIRWDSTTGVYFYTDGEQKGQEQLPWGPVSAAIHQI